MKKLYRIGRKEGPSAPSEQDISRYKNMGKLIYAYDRATEPLYRRPLYKDPKAFLVILIIVLLAVILSEVGGREAPRPGPEVPAFERP